jgi:hypothetical protein
MRRKDGKRRSRPALLGIAVALALGMLVLAGCGGSSGGGGTEASTTSASTGSGAGSSSGSESDTTEGKGPGGAMFEISEEDRKCLKEKGVELPEPGSGPRTFQKGEAPEGAEPPEGGTVPEGGQAPEGGEMPEGGPPTGAARGAMSEESKKAFEECGVEMPEFKARAGGGGPNVDSATFKKQVKEYVACVRENGFELAEPDFSGEGPIFQKSESESAAFKKASAKCSNLIGGTQSSQSG